MLKTNLSLFCLIFLLSACEFKFRQAMHDQPKFKPQQENEFFADKRAARPPVEGTIARGTLKEDKAYFTGKKDGKDVHTLPFKVTKEILKRGQERFQVYCTPCHAYTGNGDGMVVRRGFKAPTSLHTEALRNAAVGHFVDVMTNGWGQMPSYATQVPIEDRWAIAAYIRALQLSQNFQYAKLTSEERNQLEETPKKESNAHGH
jgi:hypothetical protein